MAITGYDFSSWISTLDGLVLGLAIPLIVLYFIFGLDDFMVDLLSWLLGCHPVKLSRRMLFRLQNFEQKRIAILVASWKEGGVLRQMVSGNLRSIRYGNFDFILGVYPNDPETRAEAEMLAEQYPNVRVVVNSLEGPTSKGQMLNEMVRSAVEMGKTSGESYDAFIIHDSEDLIHRYSLPLINVYLGRYDFVQVPIFSLPVEKSEFVAGTYIDEFSEHHTKDILLRQRLGVSIPSAGVGTAVSARLVEAYMKEQGGDLLNQRSLTEDYELGVSTRRFGFKSVLACHYFRNEMGEKEFIATREYFPKSFTRSIRQKTRWTVGIAFQGMEHLGWKGGLLHCYFLYRDRKGPFAQLLVAIGALFFIYCALRSVQNPEFFHRIGGSRLIWIGFAINAFFMINRVLQRMYCVSRVYGTGMALVGIIRFPIVNLINAIASFRAIQQYAMSRIFGTTLQWAKTEHELPKGFGSEAQDAVEVTGSKSA